MGRTGSTIQTTHSILPLSNNDNGYNIRRNFLDIVNKTEVSNRPYRPLTSWSSLSVIKSTLKITTQDLCICFLLMETDIVRDKVFTIRVRNRNPMHKRGIFKYIKIGDT